MENLSLRFIRWSAGLLVLGLLTGYGPLGHYLMGGVKVACPWAPVHGHVALLGWIGMAVFGLVYRALPGWANGASTPLGLVRAHFWISVVAVLGILANGIVGYRLLDFLSDGFYYRPDENALDLWLSVDGLFLSLYAVGSGLFLIVVLRSTRYASEHPQTRAIKTVSP